MSQHYQEEIILDIQNQNSNELFVFQFWNTGFESAPAVVKSCIESWKTGCQSSGFEHVLIDEENLPFWENRIGGQFGEALADFRMNAQCWPDAKWRRYSDMLRLALLTKFNGIWVDSTVLLMKPIGDWLLDHEYASGLKLCRGVNNNTIESWLICSLTSCDLLNDWANHYICYNIEVQRDASQYLAQRYSVPGLMFRIQNSLPRAKRWWFGWFLRKVYRRQPYFAIYYSFDYVVHEREQENSLHELYLPFDLHSWAAFNSQQKPNWRISQLSRTMRVHLENMPFIKLDWKRSPARPLGELEPDDLLRCFWDRSIANLNA